MPESTHDEAARFGYVVGLKQFLHSQVEAKLKSFIDEDVAPKVGAERSREQYRAVEKSLRELGPYRSWQSMMVIAQEQMWQSVADCVDRQLPQLEQRTRQQAPGGSVRTDPAFTPPAYLTAVDIHLMPGSYSADRGGDDVRQGAIFDKAASLYHMGRNGGELNDVRGHTIVQHLWDRFGPVKPQRILDLGCTVGHSTVAIASYFPDAEVHAVDVGGALLRYARARAASLGQKIHFSQQNAESTDFPDGHFDLVVSSAVMHETSNRALPRILRECHRLLSPGGHVIHLEVPARFELESTWSRIRGYFEAVHNNEPFWLTAESADVEGMLRAAGFADAKAGYQPASTRADPARRGEFTTTPGPVHRWWYIVSGTR
jgi:ubiquinone/menaquinone biosynthesis C-methylase UbiE